MSFGDHLEELRKCVVYALGGIVPIFVVAMYYSPNLMQLVTFPVREALRKAHLPETLVQTGVFESFNASVLVAVAVTVLLGAPWILWQLWRFIAPGLHSHERRFVYVLLPLSGVLTITSMVFCYGVVLPVILAFMINWGTMPALNEAPTAPLPEGITLPLIPILEHDPTDPPLGGAWITRESGRLSVALPDGVYGIELGPRSTITPSYRIQEYLSTTLTMLLSFAAAFQTPVVVLMLGWIGIIDTAFLTRFRRHAVLASIIVGALLTPGDLVSFAMITIPTYLLYELGGVLLRILPAHRVAGKRKDDDGGEDDMSEDPPSHGEGHALPPGVESHVHGQRGPE
jgi:sec-independent protein translocase protein TatC